MKILKLNSTPQKNGEIHGETFRKEIHELAAIRLELILRYLPGFTKEKLNNLSLKQIEVLKKYPDFYSEFYGIAQGSGLSEINLMILNNYTDMRDFDYHSEQNNKKIIDTGGCSSLVIKTQNQYICGQTWDMHASATPYVLKLELESESQKKSHILTLMGCLGLAGVNAQGVVVMINNMHCKETNISIMWPALVRGMLLEKTAQNAADFLKKNIPCSGHNYLIADSSGYLNIETTGKRFEVNKEVSHINEVKRDIFFHTNHYIGSLKSEEILERQSKSTYIRYKELEEYFNKEPENHFTYENIANDIFSGKKVSSVCIEKPKSDPHAPMTCGGLVYDFQKNQGEAFQGAYSDEKRVFI